MDERKRQSRVGLWSDWPWDKPVIKRYYMPLARARMKRQIPKLLAQAEDDTVLDTLDGDHSLCRTCGDCHCYDCAGPV